MTIRINRESNRIALVQIKIAVAPMCDHVVANLPNISDRKFFIAGFGPTRVADLVHPLPRKTAFVQQSTTCSVRQTQRTLLQIITDKLGRRRIKHTCICDLDRFFPLSRPRTRERLLLHQFFKTSSINCQAALSRHELRGDRPENHTRRKV